MTPEQRGDFDLLVDQYRGKDDWRPSSTIIRIDTLLAVDAELRSLRAALAASQTREAALRAALGWIVRHDQWRRDHPSAALNLEYWADTIGKPALADPSPVADALGRVARASVRRYRTFGDQLDTTKTYDDFVEADKEWIRTMDELLAVAPHWGEPQGGG